MKESNCKRIIHIQKDKYKSYLIQFTRGEYDKVIILEDERQAYFEFAKNLEYFLRYRYVTPQMIETMLEAYMAGKAFQKSLDYSQ